MEEIKQLIFELETEKKYNYQKIIHLTKSINKTIINGTLIDWLKEESNKGNTMSQNIVGDLYENGEGIEKDYKEAIKWYKLSSDQGNAISQFYLGYMYENGKGIEKNYKEAIRLYTLSANQGYASAQNNLGYMYENGYGIEKDYKEALKLYKLSADQGSENAKKNLKKIYKENEDILISLFLDDNMKVKELKKENDELKKENEELKYMAPIEGGPEYKKAKKKI
jgi:TPR repeat protein